MKRPRRDWGGAEGIQNKALSEPSYKPFVYSAQPPEQSDPEEPGSWRSLAEIFPKIIADLERGLTTATAT